MKTYFRAAAVAAAFATALGAATVSKAAKSPPPPPPPYNPQIAYTVTSKGGSTSTITVSNADGTDVVSLYSSNNITALNGLKFAPTGNRIVFTEQNDIKILTYAVSPQGVTTTSVSTLAREPFTPLHVDVSPDGTQLLVVEHTANPNQWAVYVILMSNGARTPIGLQPDLYYDAVWAHSNSRIAVIQGAPVGAGFGTQTIQVIELDPSYNIISSNTIFTSTVSQLYEVQRIESAHLSDTLIFDSYASPAGVYTINMGTMQVTSAVAGTNASFSADDSTILFIGPTIANLFTLNLNTNVQTQVTSKIILGRPDFLP